MSDLRQVRSFHVVFSLERRLHRIDRFRIPLPYGLPLRSVGYAIALLVIVLASSRLPLLSLLLGGLPAPVRLVVIPLVGSVALTRVRIDGRPAGIAGLAAAGHLVAPRTVAGWRPRRTGMERIADVTVTPDGSGPFLRRGWVRGPCDVYVAGDVSARWTRRGVVIRRAGRNVSALDGPVQLPVGERLTVR